MPGTTGAICFTQPLKRAAAAPPPRYCGTVAPTCPGPRPRPRSARRIPQARAPKAATPRAVSLPSNPPHARKAPATATAAAADNVATLQASAPPRNHFSTYAYLTVLLHCRSTLTQDKKYLLQDYSPSLKDYVLGTQ